MSVFPRTRAESGTAYNSSLIADTDKLSIHKKKITKTLLHLQLFADKNENEPLAWQVKPFLRSA